MKLKFHKIYKIPIDVIKIQFDCVCGPSLLITSIQSINHKQQNIGYNEEDQEVLLIKHQSKEKSNLLQRTNSYENYSTYTNLGFIYKVIKYIPENKKKYNYFKFILKFW